MDTAVWTKDNLMVIASEEGKKSTSIIFILCKGYTQKDIDMMEEIRTVFKKKAGEHSDFPVEKITNIEKQNPSLKYNTRLDAFESSLDLQFVLDRHDKRYGY